MLRKTMLAAVVAGAFAVIATGQFAIATTTTPADKAAVTSSDIDTVGQDAEVVLHEQMKVDSTIDLILQASSECSILTSLMTEGSDQPGATESDGAFGQVKMWLTIDDKVVPVSADDAPASSDGTDAGEVVFCNRAYQRTVTDMEDEQDGIDGEDDFIRTRTANAFNWMAFDVGTAFDDPANGNNIVDIKLWAEYDRSTTGDDPAASCGDAQADNSLLPIGKTCADAFVGSRTLIVEATHAANGETYEPEPATSESSSTSGSSIGGVSLP